MAKKIRAKIRVFLWEDGRYEATLPEFPGFSCFVTKQQADNTRLLMHAIGWKIEEFMNTNYPVK